MMAEVTVLLPVYKPNPRFLRETLESLRAQTLGNFRCVIVEAEPTGIATELLNSFNDNRFEHVSYPDQGSFVGQLNLGLEHVTTPYLARLDADDVCESMRLEMQLAYLKTHPDVAVLGSQLTIMDSESKVIGKRAYPTSPEEISKTLARKNCIAHPSVMLRTELLNKLGGYTSDYTWSEDYHLWVRFVQAGYSISNHPESLLKYRLHDKASKSTALKTMLRSTLQMKRDLLWPQMTVADKLRYHAEQAVSLLPSNIIYSLFRRVELDKKSL